MINISRLRTERKIGSLTLALNSGLSPHTLQNIEADYRRGRFSNILQLGLCLYAGPEDETRTVSWSGRRLESFRKKKKMTLKELGALVGTSYNNVYRWECGTEPLQHTVMELARVLGISPTAFYTCIGTENGTEILHQVYTLMWLENCSYSGKAERKSPPARYLYIYMSRKQIPILKTQEAS